jgi:hypothetical protein
MRKGDSASIAPSEGEEVVVRERQDPSTFRLPQPPTPPFNPEGFAQCPPTLLEGLSEEQRQAQQGLYQRALEEAQRVAKPSLPERDLLGVWN